MRKPELAIAALGLIVATLALIPAFGQWLFPRDSEPVVPVAHLLTPAPTATSRSVTEPQTPTLEPPTATVAPIANLTPDSSLVPSCVSAQSLLIELPSSPQVAAYESDPELSAFVPLAKTLVIAAMVSAIEATVSQDLRCVRELYSGAILNDLESVIVNTSFTGMINKLSIEWELSRLQDIRVRDVATFEADVCLYQSLDILNLQGQQLMTYPPEYIAATYIFQRFGEGEPYHVTGILELDPFTLCQL